MISVVFAKVLKRSIEFGITICEMKTLAFCSL